MNDFLRTQGQGVPDSMITRYVELADGTHALVVAAVLIGTPEDGGENGGGAPFLPPVDEITGAQIVIPVVHHEVHEGETFQVSFLDLTIADDAIIELHILTGAKYCHLVFEAQCGGNAEVEFSEEPTVTDNGTPLTESNMKRYSDDVATARAFHTPTYTGETALATVIIAGGTGGNSAGGGVRAGTEWILTPSTSYILTLTNRAGNSQPGSLLMQWYEESTP